MRLLLALTLLLLPGCAMFGGANEPTVEDLEKACPGAVRAMMVDCPALGVVRCEGVPWPECSEQEAVLRECDALIDAEAAKCGE